MKEFKGFGSQPEDSTVLKFWLHKTETEGRKIYVVTLSNVGSTAQPLTMEEALDLYNMARADTVMFTPQASFVLRWRHELS